MVPEDMKAARGDGHVRVSDRGYYWSMIFPEKRYPLFGIML